MSAPSDSSDALTSSQRAAYTAARDEVLTRWGGLEAYCLGMFRAGLAYSTPGASPADEVLPSAEDALQKALSYADGSTSDYWNQMIESTDGETRIAGLAHVAVADAAKAQAWSSLAVALFAKESRRTPGGES